MLRVDQRREGATIVVQAEGGVAGPWVAELRRVLASVEGEPQDVSLDLAEVGFVDASGEALLREALARGVRIRRQSGFVAALLDQDGGEGRPASPGAMPDAELLDAALEGSEEAFLALASRCHGPMQDVAGCFVADERAAREVVREAWGELLEGLRSWDRRRPLGPWAASVAARRARARAARDGSVVAGEPADVEPLEPAAPRPHPGELRDPWRADQLGSAGALDALRAAIAELPPMQRAVVTMRDVTGCGAEETSLALGVPVARQRALLHRGRCRLRAALEERLGAAA